MIMEVAAMAEAHVRVICEIRNILKEMQPTLARLRHSNNAMHLRGRHSLVKKLWRDVDVENMIQMCEELSNTLWFEGRDT